MKGSGNGGGARFLVAFALALAAGACRRSETAPESLKAAAPAFETRVDSYRPPADGRLVPRQIEKYIEVRTRATQRAERALPEPPEQKGLGDALFATPPDIEAARALGVNTEEYLWVKEKIHEAEGARLAAKLDADFIDLLTKNLATLAKRRAEAQDEPSRKLLSEQLATFENELARVKREQKELEPEDVRANMRILEPFRARLQPLEAETARLRQRVRAPASEKK
ncbi:MAG: hypothetical protein JNK60_10290 [Acidobacteria bacterium]|nr:hypothetical protein [Acidobacteriota bacterium]